MQKPLHHLKNVYWSSNLKSRKNGQFSVLILPDVPAEHLTKLTPSFVLLPECHIKLAFLLPPWLHHLSVNFAYSFSDLLALGPLGSNLWTSSLAILTPQTRISNFLINISTWMFNRHRKLNLSKTKFLTYNPLPIYSCYFPHLSKRTLHYSLCSDQDLKLITDSFSHASYWTLQQILLDLPTKYNLSTSQPPSPSRSQPP